MQTFSGMEWRDIASLKVLVQDRHHLLQDVSLMNLHNLPRFSWLGKLGGRWSQISTFTNSIMFFTTVCTRFLFDASKTVISGQQGDMEMLKD